MLSPISRKLTHKLETPHNAVIFNILFSLSFGYITKLFITDSSEIKILDIHATINGIVIFVYFSPAYRITISLDKTKTPKHIGTIMNNSDEIEFASFSSYFSWVSFFKIYDNLGIETFIIEYGMEARVLTR